MKWKLSKNYKTHCTARLFSSEVCHSAMTILWNFKAWTFMCFIVCLIVSVSLNHWGQVTHICIGNLTIIGPDNGLSPGQRQAIIWTNAWILLIGPWGTNFSEILIGIQTFSFKKMHLKMASGKWRPFCHGLNVLKLVWRWSIPHLVHPIINEAAAEHMWYVLWSWKNRKWSEENYVRASH